MNSNGKVDCAHYYIKSLAYLCPSLAEDDTGERQRAGANWGNLADIVAFTSTNKALALM